MGTFLTCLSPTQDGFPGATIKRRLLLHHVPDFLDDIGVEKAEERFHCRPPLVNCSATWVRNC